MTAQSQQQTPKPRTYETGHRLYCPTCGAEIEIIVPCTGASAGQVLRCCGRDMTLEVGRRGNMESES